MNTNNILLWEIDSDVTSVNTEKNVIGRESIIMTFEVTKFLRISLESVELYVTVYQGAITTK